MSWVQVANTKSHVSFIRMLKKNEDIFIVQCSYIYFHIQIHAFCSIYRQKENPIITGLLVYTKIPNNFGKDLNEELHFKNLACNLLPYF